MNWGYEIILYPISCGLPHLSAPPLHAAGLGSSLMAASHCFTATAASASARRKRHACSTRAPSCSGQNHSLLSQHVLNDLLQNTTHIARGCGRWYRQTTLTFFIARLRHVLQWPQRSCSLTAANLLTRRFLAAAGSAGGGAASHSIGNTGGCGLCCFLVLLDAAVGCRVHCGSIGVLGITDAGPQATGCCTTDCCSTFCCKLAPRWEPLAACAGAAMPPSTGAPAAAAPRPAGTLLLAAAVDLPACSFIAPPSQVGSGSGVPAGRQSGWHVPHAGQYQ